MSAVLHTREAWFEAMGEDRLDQVLAVEKLAYNFPWSRGNFVDSLKAGYQAQLLRGGGGGDDDDDGALLGYFVAMKGFEEVHLLNLAVAPVFQGQGWGRVMLDALAIWSRAQGAQWLWLEVRVSNHRAIVVYEQYGFRRVGERKNYYPASEGSREHAQVLSLQL